MITEKTVESITLRDATLDDQDMIFEHMTRIWGPDQAIEKKKMFEWLYLNNPLTGGELTKIFIFTDEEKVLGISLSTPVNMLFKGKEMRISWWGSVSLDEELRTTGISARFSERMKAQHMWGCGFPIESTLPLYFKSRDSRTDITDVPGSYGLVVKALRIDPVIPFKPLRPLANKLYTLGDKALTLLNRGFIQKGYTAERVSRFDESFDEWFAGVKSGYDDMIILDYDHKYLNWRYVDSPVRDYTPFLVRKNGKVAGFLIFEEYLSRGVTVCAIVEFLAARDDSETYKFILANGVRRARRRKAFLVKVFESYNPEFKKLFRSFGFLPGRSTKYPLLIHLPVTMDRDFVLDPANYYICRGFADPKVI